MFNIRLMKSLRRLTLLDMQQMMLNIRNIKFKKWFMKLYPPHQQLNI
jgi:hypothetical protein